MDLDLFCVLLFGLSQRALGCNWKKEKKVLATFSLEIENKTICRETRKHTNGAYANLLPIFLTLAYSRLAEKFHANVPELTGPLD